MQKSNRIQKIWLLSQLDSHYQVSAGEVKRITELKKLTTII